jgi:hypothetical protein
MRNQKKFFIRYTAAISSLSVVKKSLCGVAIIFAPIFASADNLVVESGNGGNAPSSNATGTDRNISLGIETFDDINVKSGNGGIGGNGMFGAASINGGSGGFVNINAVSITADNVNITSGISGVGGNGGAGGNANATIGVNGNIGGDSGSVHVDITSNLVSNNISIIGGAGSNGGNGGLGGAGGAGGNANGNTGGNGGNGSSGGSSGSIVFNANNIVSDMFMIIGGNGGTGGSGGNGGSIHVKASSVTVNNLYIRSGFNGAVSQSGSNGNSGTGIYAGSGGSGGIRGSGGNRGIGGNVFFTADSLTAPNITITKNDGLMDFSISTLNVLNYTTLIATGVNAGDISISRLYFDLSNMANESTMLSVSSNLHLSNVPSLSLGFNSGTVPLEIGHSVVLIDNYGNVANYNQSTIKINHGAILEYDFDITTNGSDLIATLQNVKVSKQTKSYSKGYLSSIAFLNSADELLSNENLKKSVFIEATYGQSKYKIDSDIDTKGFSAIVGVSKGIDDFGYAGLYFENGGGSYDITGGAKANGDVKYYGFGLLSMFELGESAYIDANIKMGKVKNEFKMDDAGINYELDSLYYGAHLGLGYKIKFFDTSMLDLSAKYFYMHENGDDTKIFGDGISFQDIDSNRIKFGARLSFNEFGPYYNPFIALNYEHEFDGYAEVSTYSYNMDVLTLEGNTGIGEIGIEITPNKFWYLNLNLKGYVGKREGASAKCEIEYKF